MRGEDQITLALLALVLCAGCNRIAPARGSGGDTSESMPDASPTATTSTTAAPVVAPGSVPLTAAESIIDVPLAGFLSAVATLPAGSSGPRPVAIAVHGMSDGPQWACPLWRGVLGGGVFILCPRGVKEHDQPPGVTPGTTYYTFTTWQALDAEIEEGLAALRERFPGRLDDGLPLYIGFSLGARFGISIALAHPGRYPRLLLSEGGHDAWTATTREVEAGVELLLAVDLHPHVAAVIGRVLGVELGRLSRRRSTEVGRETSLEPADQLVLRGEVPLFLVPVGGGTSFGEVMTTMPSTPSPRKRRKAGSLPPCSARQPAHATVRTSTSRRATGPKRIVTKRTTTASPGGFGRPAG